MHTSIVELDQPRSTQFLFQRLSIASPSSVGMPPVLEMRLETAALTMCFICDVSYRTIYCVY